MKTHTRGLLCTLISSFLLSACSQSPASQSLTPVAMPDDLMALSQLDKESAADEITAAFLQVLEHSAKSADWCLQLAQHQTSKKPATDCDNAFYVREDDRSSVITMASDGDSLYEVIRSGSMKTTAPLCTAESSEEKADRDAYVALVETGVNGTSAISCTLQEEGSVFADTPQLVYSMALPQNQQEALESSAELASALHNQELQMLTPLFGASLPVTPWQKPELFTYSLEQEGSTWIFTIQADLDAWNQSLDAEGTRKDLFQTGNYVADDFSTTTAQVILNLSADGVLLSSQTVYENAFTLYGESWTDGERQMAWLSPVPAQDTLQSLDSLFASIRSGELEAGSAFELPLIPEPLDEEILNTESARAD